MRTLGRGRAVGSKRREWSIDHILVAKHCPFPAVIIATTTENFRSPFHSTSFYKA